jgi:hypothetical protein
VVHLKPESDLDGLLLFLTFTAIITNLAFMIVIQKYKRIYLYYLFWGLGALYSPVILIIGAFEMVGMNNFSPAIFGSIFLISFIVLIYIYSKGFDGEFLLSNLTSNHSKYSWDINIDVNAKENRQNEGFVNFIRLIIAPFAPVLGMTISRNFDGQQEWFFNGLILLILALVVYSGMLKYCVLGFKFLFWQKSFKSNIDLVSP